MPALSQKVHMRRPSRREHRWCREPLLARRGPGSTGVVSFQGRLLPADAPAQLDGLPLLLAAVEHGLEPGGQDHEHGEEHHYAEREEGDDLVVRLPPEALAVVAGDGGGGWDQPGREHEQGSHLAHGRGTIPCRPRWPSPFSASSRSRRGAATSTSGITSTTRSGSTASSSRRRSIRPTTGSFPTRCPSTAIRST